MSNSSGKLQGGSIVSESRLGQIDLDLTEQACARLGDAVVDPAVWPELMVDICEGVGAQAALLLQTDVRTSDVPRTPNFEECTRYYFGNNWHLNDSRGKKGVPLLLAGESVIIDEDIFTPEEPFRDPFFNDCLLPHDVPWFAAIGFRSGSALWALSLQRSGRIGRYSKTDKRVLATLAPRLTEVATLSAALSGAALNGTTTALGLVGRPALAIGRFGAVLDVNAAADGLFDDELSVRNGRLSIRDADARAAFERFVACMGVILDTAALPTERIVVRRRGKPSVVIGLLPVPAAARTPFLGARAIVTFTELTPSRGPTAAVLMETFGMTPAEAKLAAIVAEGASLEEAADRLGIARETARAQIKSVFGKTDTRRQAELAARLAAIFRFGS
jgi:DNA-binding CsgD family transcriptional regulator